MNQPLLIGLDIGGTKIRVATAHPHEPTKFLRVETVPTPESWRIAQSQLKPLIDHMAEGHPIGAFGVVSPAPIDAEKGIIGHPTNLQWHQAPVKKWVRQHWSCPFVIGDDATYGGVCEAQYGASQGVRYALYVSISTGIGSGLTLDGWPLPGPHNTEGGRQVLALDGESGVSFESLTSGSAIVRDYGKIAADIKDRKTWNAIARRLALGLHNLIVATDPELVVLAGGVSRHHKRFLVPLRRQLAALHPIYPLPPISPARYIEEAPLIGALLHAGETAGLTHPPKPVV